MPRRSLIEGARPKRVKRSFRLIEKCSRSNFDEFLSNKMTDNEPNNLHIYKQKKEKTLPLHSVPVLEPKSIYRSLEEQNTIENVS